MNIMNKLYKCALGLLTAFILSFACFSNALSIDGRIVSSVGTDSNGLLQLSANSSLNFVCVRSSDSICGNITITQSNDNTITTNGNSYNNLVCLQYDSSYVLNIQGPNQQCYYNVVRMNLDSITEEYCSVMSSLECQTEYNLIPISEVTANYCALNFGMIDPQECPINSGTGTIVRSNLMINDIPYAQNQNINVFIPDFLAWNISFNDLYTVIEVEGYDADESYIENVINQEKLTPTNKDIEDMLTGFMTNYFPYLALAIVFLYLARKIFKIFK